LASKFTSIYYGVDDDRQIVNVYFVKDNRQQQPKFYKIKKLHYGLNGQTNLSTNFLNQHLHVAGFIFI